MPGNSVGTIAQAYVQIMPSTEGMQGSLTNLLGGEADNAGKSAGGKFAGAFGTAAKALSGAALAGFTTAAAGAAKLGKEALASYADYEQLTGGIETLFKSSSDTVMEYASAAYKTAGLSANEYMETVTGFSASLIASLGGDTEEAAQLANMAITDMSDNANKMGSDMQSIQNAYQGFAKQNYTMLDNLKLGYGGTKEEMERLLADAEAISGIHFDVSSYADVVEAIHVIQTEMGITGTTAEEAATTISGSAQMMKSSWANLVTGIADENADIDKLIDDFVDSALTYAENVIPRIGVILEGGGKLLKEGAAKLLPVVIDTLIDAAPDLAKAGIQLIITLAVALVSATPRLVAAVPEIIRALYDGFMAGTADIRAAGAELMESAKAAILEKVEAAKDWGSNLVTNMVESIRAGIETVRSTAAELMESAKAAILEKVEAAKDWGRDLIQNFIDGIFSKWEDLKSSVRDVAQTVKDFLGFSEPTVGPLSDFHTYAPDMIDLWNEGIRSKEAEMRRQLASSFDLRPTIERAGSVQEAAAPRAPEPADNAAVLALLERNVRLLERIESEFSGLRVKGRMA